MKHLTNTDQNDNRLFNVPDGVNDQDAVNKRQLNSKLNTADLENGVKDIVYLSPSNNSDDRATIQAVLDQASSKPMLVRGRPGETYTISGPLVIRSNTVLDMRTCTINANPANNILVNASVVPLRTVTTAATTAGSNIINASGAAFTSADIGRAVGVIGAGPNYGRSDAPGSLYGTITAVNSSTQIVLSQPATLSGSGRTLRVFPTRDTNISIIGGRWNGGNKEPISQTQESHGFLIRRCDGVSIKETSVTLQRTSVGGSYAISLGDVTNVDAQSLHFEAGSDGIHVQGPSSYITIHNVFGTTGDDMVAFTGVDGQTRTGSLLGDVEGDISNVIVSNVLAHNSWTSLKVTSGIGTNGVQRKVTNFFAHSFTGSTQEGVVNIIDYAGNTWFDGTIRDVDVSWGTNKAMVHVGATHAKSVTLEGLHIQPHYIVPTVGYVSVTKPVEALVINNLVANYSDTDTSRLVGLSANVGSLRLSNVTILGSPIEAQIVEILNTNVNVGSISGSNISSNANPGNLVKVDDTRTGSKIDSISASNITFFRGAIIDNATNSTSKTNILVSNYHVSDRGAIALVSQPADVRVSNAYIDSGGGAIRAMSATATPINIYGTAATINQTLWTRTGSQVVNVPRDDIEGKKGDTGWISPTMGTGFVSDVGLPVAFRRIGSVIYIKGQVSKSSGSIGNNDVFFTLPGGFRPTQRRVYLTAIVGNNVLKVAVDVDGKVFANSAPSATSSYTLLDVISFTSD